MLDGISQAGGFVNYSMDWARRHQQQLLAQPLDAASNARFEASVQASFSQQAQLEAAEQGSFDDFVARYYA